MDAMTQEQLDDLRPIIHQHMSMLTAAGITPVAALAIASHVAALVYSNEFDEALKMAVATISAGRSKE